MPNFFFGDNDVYPSVTAACFFAQNTKKEPTQQSFILLHRTKKIFIPNMISTTTITLMSINNTINNVTKNKSLSLDLNNHMEESFHLTWNDILYDGGLASSIPRSSFRWLTIFVCLIGIIGNLNLFFNQVIIY